MEGLGTCSSSSAFPEWSLSGTWERADEGFFGTSGCPSPHGNPRAYGHFQGSSSGPAGLFPWGPC